MSTISRDGSLTKMQILFLVVLFVLGGIYAGYVAPSSYHILDRVTGSDSSVTDYILDTPARCPNCRHDVLEKTLIEPE